MSKRTRILVLAANPKGTVPLNLDEEVREIDEGLRRGKNRTQYELLQQWAVRPRDVRRAILDHSPDIVHFCGHGVGDEGLALEDDNGSMRLVSTEALSGLFELFSDKVKCVLLNACYSEIQAKSIVTHIEYVIGMSRSIGDRAAIEFAVGFYDALFAGKTIEVAYRFGTSAIQMAGIKGHQIPVLLKKSEVEQIILSTQKPLQKLLPGKIRGDSLFVVSLRDLESRGRTIDDIITELLMMDYDTITGLDDTAAGNLNQWKPVVENNPDGFVFVVDDTLKIIGYWHFVALQDYFFKRVKSGEIEDEEITVENMRFLGIPGIYDIYFIIVAVLKGYRGYKVNRMLYDGFIKRITELAESGVYVKNICANAFTPEGEALCKSIGMKFLTLHNRRGKIYILDMSEAEILLSGVPELQKIYLEKIREK
ncbi:MAG: CHAT domain-containing protein [Chlorobaculum sp.]|nr:CHAT domain-containing protein [Chlorobaculum sp.]